MFFVATIYGLLYYILYVYIVLCEYCFYFIGSVVLNDPNNICGRCVKPEIVASLLCYVNNTGARGAGNVLIWNTPVSKIKSVIYCYIVFGSKVVLDHVYFMWVCPYHAIVCDF